MKLSHSRFDKVHPVHSVLTSVDLEVGDIIHVETQPGQGVKISVKADGTLRIEVDVDPDAPRCLALVPDESG